MGLQIIAAIPDKREQMRVFAILQQDQEFDKNCVRTIRTIGGTGLWALKKTPGFAEFLCHGEFERLFQLVNKMEEYAEGIIFGVMAEILQIRIVHHQWSEDGSVDQHEYSPK
jgi:hypothetical protein